MAGTNSVVNRSFSNDNLTIAGVPAMVVKENNKRNLRAKMLKTLRVET